MHQSQPLRLYPTGGHFAAKCGGHFKTKIGGQFKTKIGGQLQTKYKGSITNEKGGVNLDGISTTVSDSENYKVYYYNSLDYLEEVHAKKSNSICRNLQKSETEITRCSYRKDGKMTLQTIINSCCTLRLKYDYLTNTTANY